MNDLIDTNELSEYLHIIGLKHWPEILKPMIAKRLSITNHGDFGKWQKVVRSLSADKNDCPTLRNLLLQLSPWRKGPFNIGDIYIDTEWRSDQKWGRLRNSIETLKGKNVLDVGCGNGYFAFEMRAAGAKTVIGIDPTLLFVMQFLAINVFKKDPNIFVLPARLHELPLPSHQFDTTFSMGVLYHQRSPIDHLRQLRKTLKPNGQLVLETLFLPGNDAFASTPEDRYARMQNVWLLPSIPELEIWLRRSGYTNIQVVNESITTVSEQRSTEWMTFESLREALDPDDPTLTVEGWPAPHRVIVTAIAT